jgi:hypothetical protein
LVRDIPAVKCERIVSIIGAGDNLNTGIISAIIETGKLTLDELSESEWLNILQRGLDFSSAVCGIKDSSLGRSELLNLVNVVSSHRGSGISLFSKDQN